MVNLRLWADITPVENDFKSFFFFFFFFYKMSHKAFMTVYVISHYTSLISEQYALKTSKVILKRKNFSETKVSLQSLGVTFLISF